MPHVESEKTFLVVNPASAGGQTGKGWLRLEAKLRKTLGSVELAFTREPLDAERLTREALRAGFGCVAAVGGDGTVNEAVNGFFDGETPVAPHAALAVIPRGTGGDFRRTFGWENDFDAALARIVRGEERKLDVGRVTYTTPEGKPAARRFVNICSFGASGVVDREVNSASKLLGGKLSFMIGSVKALLRYTDCKIRFTLDGGKAVEQSVTTLAVANGRYFGGGMCVAPKADPFDGWFDVTVWSGYTLADFALKSRRLYDGTHVELAGTTTYRCRKLEATCDGEALLDVDGEQPGRLPCAMTLLPAALNVRV